MKKIITKLLLIFFLLWIVGINFIDNTFAEKDVITVKTTEKIPGADCKEIPWINTSEVWPIIPWPSTWECKIKPWFGSVMKMMWAIIKYFTFIAGLWGVLFIVINGIMYSMGGMDQGMKDESKKRITKTLVWLILLFLSWAILNMIAPWIYV